MDLDGLVGSWISWISYRFVDVFLGKLPGAQTAATWREALQAGSSKESIVMVRRRLLSRRTCKRIVFVHAHVRGG